MPNAHRLADGPIGFPAKLYAATNGLLTDTRQFCPRAVVLSRIVRTKPGSCAGSSRGNMARLCFRRRRDGVIGGPTQKQTVSNRGHSQTRLVRPFSDCPCFPRYCNRSRLRGFACGFVLPHGVRAQPAFGAVYAPEHVV